MSEQGARIFDVGYRSYDGPRRGPSWALLTVWRHTIQRVLGLRRAFRHKLLPGFALVTAFLPALVIAGISAFLPVDPILDDILPSYGEYTETIVTALTLFAAFVAPEALCTDRRTKMLELYLAGPLDATRYLASKWAAVLTVMLAMTVGPQLFILASFTIEGAGPSLADTPLLLGRILLAGLGVALFYTAVSLGVASLTPRRAVAAVAIVLVLFVSMIGVEAAVESGGAPEELALVSPAVATEFAWRTFDEVRGPLDASPPIQGVSTPLVVAGLVAWIAVGALVCLLAYRREGGRG